MFLIRNFLFAIANMLDALIVLGYIFLIMRAVFSLMDITYYNSLTQFVLRITDMVINPVRRFMNEKISSAVDLSLVVVFLILIFIQTFLIQSLRDFAQMLQ